RAEISVIRTSSLAIAANGGAAVDVPMFRNDEIVLPFAPLATPFTGKAEAEGMHGFTDHGRLTVTQLYPGSLTVRSVTKNVVAGHDDGGRSVGRDARRRPDRRAGAGHFGWRRFLLRRTARRGDEADRGRAHHDGGQPRRDHQYG